MNLPESLSYLMDWWHEVAKERQVSFGISPLETEKILRWLNIYDIIPLDFELKAVKEIDDAFMEAINGRSKTSARGGQQPSKTGNNKSKRA